jgi:Tol biopolymer transport system component
MQGRLTDKTLVTRREVLLGTPVYMSPEQLNLDADTVDARSDVYSLGVLLYELIAGAPPYEGATLREAAFSEVQRILREVEPPKPSTRLGELGSRTTEIAKRRAVEPLVLQRLLKGDLDWVVMRALEKEPGRRYASAEQLAQDIQCHLSHRPVSAGPPSFSYRAQKFAHRHRASLAWAAAITVLLSLWALSSLRQAREAHRAAEEAREIAATARATASRLAGEGGDTKSLRYITDIVNVQSGAALSPDETMLAYVDWLPNGDLHVQYLDTGTVRNLTRSNERAPGIYEFCPTYFVWSPDSKWIAYLWFGGSETDASLRVVKADTGEVRVLKPYGSDATYTPVDWTPDGRHILCEVERRSRMETLVLVSIETGEDQKVMEVTPPIPEHVRISPDGRFLVYARRQKTGDPTAPRDIHLFELATSQTSLLTTWAGDDSAPLWAPDDPVVLYSSDHLGDVDLWAVHLEERHAAPPPVLLHYGIGDCAKRMAQSGKLLVHRNLEGSEGYNIPGSDPSETMVWEEGEGRLPAGALDGVVYLTIGGVLHSMLPEGTRKLTLPPNVSGEPSHILHGGQRWFLQTRELPGAPYPSGQSRKELFAVREDGDEAYAVQLTDHPSHEPTEAVRWATDRETGAKDGLVSWCARVWEKGNTNATPVIFTAEIAFDKDGNVTGLTEPTRPLVNDAWSHDWSPAGEKLVYETRGQLLILDLTSGQHAPFAAGSDPSWSPDGTRIAFHSKMESIQTLTLDRAERKTLVARREFGHVANHGTVGKPVWAPDSARILLHYRAPMDHQGDILRMPAAGGRPQNLTADVGYALPVAWRTAVE